MVKQPKLRLSLLSLQICRPTKSSILPQVPLPVSTVYKLSTHISSRSFDISYPNFPSPPPSTPTQSFCKSHVSSKITSQGSGSCTMQVASKCTDEISSPVYYKMKAADEPDPKMHNSTVSQVEMEGKRDKTRPNKSKDGDQAKSLLSSSPRSDLPHDYNYRHPGNKKMKQKGIHSGRFIPCTSENGKVGNSTMPKSDSRVKKAACVVGGKVKESFVVEKRSADPYEDFKKSMLEMILEKQIFEANELDQLVLCLLSLNSRQYHAVILKAFGEIWEELFSGTTN